MCDDDTINILTDGSNGQAEPTIKERLEYIRGELRAERISYDDLAELQSLAQHIGSGDMELLEAAGVPEDQAYVAKGQRNLA